MAKNRYYYYDEETFSFVELRAKRSKLIKRATITFLIACIVAGVMSWAMDRMIGTPQELALIEENSALQEQLGHVQERLQEFSGELETLSRSDQDLYRTILQAEPISEDVRQVGVGGSDAYEEFQRFNPSTTKLLSETSKQLDQLERQVNLQNESYRELSRLAEKRSAWLAQIPAILPANGEVVSGHGIRMHPILHIRRMHHGIDILVPEGTPVHSTGDGVVAESGQNAGLGKYIKIKHPATGYTTVYAHLSKIPEHVRRGRKVRRGELIGLSGDTGLSAAPHLHYEVRLPNRRSVNPIYFFLPSMTPEQFREKFSELDSIESSLG